MPPKRPLSGANQQRTPSQRSVSSRVTPTSNSPTTTPNLRHIPPDSPKWTDLRTTCLSLAGRPQVLAPEDNTGRLHVLALEEEAGCAGGQSRPPRGSRTGGGGGRCLRRRTKPAGQRCSRCKRKHLRRTFWRMRPGGQRCSRKQSVRYVYGQKIKTEELTHNN